jgi:type IV secretory pathway TrbF-like protein
MLNAIKKPLQITRGVSGPRLVAAEKAVKTVVNDAEEPRHEILSPYIKARHEWNERYGDYISQARHWRMMALISGLVAVIALTGLVYIRAQGKIVPYVVEVDKLGQPATVVRNRGTNTVDSRVIKAYLARFIADWRDVTIDRQVQKGAVDRVYAMLPRSSVALRKIGEFFRASNPFLRATTESVSVTLTDLLPTSDQSWQVEWQEVTRDAHGAVKSTVRMKASILVGITPPTDESLILINPVGIYIMDASWSRAL